MSSRHIRGPWAFDSVTEYTGSSTIVVVNESLILVNKTVAGATAVTLPAPGVANGTRMVWVIDKKGDASTNNITVTPASGTINGSSTHVISEDYGGMIYMDNGTIWETVLPPAVSATEIGFLNGITAGTVLASKAVVVGTQKQQDVLTVASSAAAQVAISNGDGSTANTPKAQILGTTKATGSELIASFSATATSAAAPSLNFLKSANATIGSNTVVASGEVLGEINFFGADGTDFNSAAARIQAVVDATPGTGDMPGRLVFATSVDNAETLTEAMRINNAQQVVVGAVAAQAVSTGDGSTSATPRMQVWGTTNATGTLLVGCANTTDATSGGIAIVKGGNAAVGSFTTVASGESLGTITWFGDNGTDYLSPAAKIEAIVDATPGAADMPGRLTFSTTTDGTETLTEAMRIDNAQRLITGGVAAQTVGSTMGSEQNWGTTAAKAQVVVGCANTTAGTGAEIAFARDKGATVGSFTAVASGDVLGSITAYGANGLNYVNAHAQIQFTVSNTPGTSDAPGAIILKTTPDGSTTLTEAFRITDQQVMTSLAARPANVTAAGSLISTSWSTTDVTNATFTQASHGSGTVSYFIGNQSITTSSDSRIKTNIVPFDGSAVASIKKAPQLVSFNYNLPTDGTPDGEKYSPNARGRYLGFLAQETIDWAPWAVNAGAGKDCPKCRAGQKCEDKSHGIWQVEYQHLVPLLIRAVQELTAKIEVLEAKGA